MMFWILHIITMFVVHNISFLGDSFRHSKAKITEGVRVQVPSICLLRRRCCAATFPCLIISSFGTMHNTKPNDEPCACPNCHVTASINFTVDTFFSQYSPLEIKGELSDLFTYANQAESYEWIDDNKRRYTATLVRHLGNLLTTLDRDLNGEQSPK